MAPDPCADQNYSGLCTHRLRTVLERGAVGLAGGEEGELVELDDALGSFENGDAALLEPRPAGGEIERRRCHDERADTFTEARVGLADDGGLANVWMRLEDAFHLGGGDVLAGPDDDVLHAADDREPAVGVDGGEVAGAEPALPDGGAGRLGVRVAHEQLRAAQPQLARVAVGENASRFRIADPQLGRAGRAPVRLAL